MKIYSKQAGLICCEIEFKEADKPVEVADEAVARRLLRNPTFYTKSEDDAEKSIVEIKETQKDEVIKETQKDEVVVKKQRKKKGGEV